MQAIRKTFVDWTYIKMSAQGLQTNEFKVLKKKQPQRMVLIPKNIPFGCSE